MALPEFNQLELKLLEDHHVTTIHRSDYSEFPKIDYTLWRAKKYAERTVGELQEYLARNYVEDDFGEDHDGRNEWIAGKDKETYKFLCKSPLRPIAYSNVYLSVSSLRRRYKGTNHDELERLTENILENYPDDYDVYPIADKVKLVEETKRKVYEILRFLSLQKPAKKSRSKRLSER